MTLDLSTGARQLLESLNRGAFVAGTDPFASELLQARMAEVFSDRVVITEAGRAYLFRIGCREAMRRLYP